MHTGKLIEQLGQDLAPVRPLKPPAARAALWLIGTVVYLSVLVVLMFRFRPLHGGVATELWLSQLVGVVAAVLAAIAAFASIVPGYSRRVLIGPVLATAAWLAVFAIAALRGGAGPGILDSSQEWTCAAIIVLGGLPLLAALAFMLRKGAPLNPVLTALLGAVAVGLLANFGACVALPHPNLTVTLAWHGGALVVLALICIAGSRFFLTWNRRAMGT